MALHVSDDGGDLGVRQADEVVEVAAHLHAVTGWQIAGGHVQAVHRHERTGQQTELEALRQLVLGVALPGAVQGLGNQGTDGGEGGALLQRAGAGLPIADHADSEVLSGGHER